MRNAQKVSSCSPANLPAVQYLPCRIWAIEPKNDNMQEVVHRMREYGYPLAEQKGIDFTLFAEDTVQKLLLSIFILLISKCLFAKAQVYLGAGGYPFGETTALDLTFEAHCRPTASDGFFLGLRGQLAHILVNCINAADTTAVTKK